MPSDASHNQEWNWQIGDGLPRISPNDQFWFNTPLGAIQAMGNTWLENSQLQTSCWDVIIALETTYMEVEEWFKNMKQLS